MEGVDLKPLFEALKAGIAEVDTKLDSVTGSTASVKAGIINGLVEGSKDSWENVSTKLIEQLTPLDPETQLGFYYGLMRSLDNKYGKDASQHVAKLVEAAPKPEPLLKTEEEIKNAQEERKKLYDRIKTVYEMAEAFGDEALSSMELPAKRTGAKGKRGPRALSFVTWTIDGKEFDKLKDVAELYPQFAKVADLTKALREEATGFTVKDADGNDVAGKGIDTKTPPERFELNLPDGKTLVGVYSAPTPEQIAAAPVEDDDDGDDTSDDETPETE